MVPPTPTLYFDFIDPLSRLLAAEIEELPGGDRIEWIGFELRPPPEPLVSIDAPELAARWQLARRLAEARKLSFAPPELVPWTRKAHELALHAPPELGTELRRRLFDAYLVEGRDIGRVDVLVDIAGDLGMDTSETKAVLDVDRYEGEVGSARARAVSLGIDDTPTLLDGERRLGGFHNRDALGTFLPTPSPTPADPNSPE